MATCPSGFQISPTGEFSCVHECPRSQGFELRTVAGAPACVYTDRPATYFSLRILPGSPTTPEQLAQYTTATEEYNNALQLAVNGISRETRLADAFQALQNAENTRDTAPQAYQEARVRYYTLLNGEEWLTQEQTRVLNAEAKPKAESYLATYTDLATRRNQQQKTMDVVNAVKDRVLSMKDDFQMTTDVFSKQITELKNQIQLESKAKAKTTSTVVGWMDMLLNALLVLALLVAVVVIGKATFSTTPQAYTATPGIK